MMKLCINCKHHLPSPSGPSSAKCALAPTKTDPVTGEVTRDFGTYGYCFIERDMPILLDILTGVCGKRARWFVPIEQTPRKGHCP